MFYACIGFYEVVGSAGGRARVSILESVPRAIHHYHNRSLLERRLRDYFDLWSWYIDFLPVANYCHNRSWGQVVFVVPIPHLDSSSNDHDEI